MNGFTFFLSGSLLALFMLSPIAAVVIGVLFVLPLGFERQNNQKGYA